MSHELVPGHYILTSTFTTRALMASFFPLKAPFWILQCDFVDRAKLPPSHWVTSVALVPTSKEVITCVVSQSTCGITIQTISPFYQGPPGVGYKSLHASHLCYGFCLFMFVGLCLFLYELEYSIDKVQVRVTGR